MFNAAMNNVTDMRIDEYSNLLKENKTKPMNNSPLVILNIGDSNKSNKPVRIKMKRLIINIFSMIFSFILMIANATICNVRSVCLTLKSNNFCEESPVTAKP